MIKPAMNTFKLHSLTMTPIKERSHQYSIEKRNSALRQANGMCWNLLYYTTIEDAAIFSSYLLIEHYCRSTWIVFLSKKEWKSRWHIWEAAGRVVRKGWTWFFSSSSFANIWEVGWFIVFGLACWESSTYCLTVLFWVNYQPWLSARCESILIHMHTWEKDQYQPQGLMGLSKKSHYYS